VQGLVAGQPLGEGLDDINDAVADLRRHLNDWTREEFGRIIVRALGIRAAIS
jgi:hypothetical protein